MADSIYVDNIKHFELLVCFWFWCAFDVLLFEKMAFLYASIGMIGLWFEFHSHTPIIRHQLWPFWANLDRRNFGCVARSAVLLKLNVANILLFSFCEQKFVQHGPITIAIDCNGLSLLIFKEKCLNYAVGPKSAPNSDSFWVRRFFNVCVRFSVPQMRQFCLFKYPPISKWASS